MKALKELAVATFLSIVICTILVIDTANAQITVFNQSTSLPTVQSQIVTGSIWPLAAAQGGFENCGNSFAITQPGNKGSYTASERHAAALTYQQCLSSLRAVLVAEATSQAANPQAAAVEANSIALTFQALDAGAQKSVDTTGAEASFMGISFGVGLGVSYSGSKRVSEGEVGADGNIRAVKSETEEPRVIFESHYYGWCTTERCKKGQFGIGPFFGIVAKDDKLISAIAAGVMVGWKGGVATDANGFSIGLGIIVDSDVTSLAPGFEVGKPLPAGEATVKYETKSRSGALLFFTRTF